MDHLQTKNLADPECSGLKVTSFTTTLFNNPLIQALDNIVFRVARFVKAARSPIELAADRDKAFKDTKVQDANQKA